MFRRLPQLLFIAYAGFVIYVTVHVNSGRGIPWIGAIGAIANLPHFDKAGHFIFWGGLSFLAVLEIVPRMKSPPKKATLRVVSILSIIFAIEEISQGFVPDRTLSLADFLFSFLGGALGGYLAYRLLLCLSASLFIKDALNKNSR